jgi:hypothetical protein
LSCEWKMNGNVRKKGFGTMTIQVGVFKFSDDTPDMGVAISITISLIDMSTDNDNITIH